MSKNKVTSKGVKSKVTGKVDTIKGSSAAADFIKANIPKNIKNAAVGGLLGGSSLYDMANNTDTSGLATDITDNGVYGQAAQGYVASLLNGYNSQYGQFKTNYDNTVSSTNANRDRIANNAYQAYMQSRKAQNDLASNYGMTGGAKEGMSVRNIANYNSNYASNESGRGQDLQTAKNSFDSNIASAKQAYNNSVAEANYNAAVADQQRTDSINATNYQAWASTVPGSFTTKSQITKAIGNLSTSDPYYTQKKELLQSRYIAVGGTTSNVKGTSSSKSGSSKSKGGSSKSKSGSGKKK